MSAIPFGQGRWSWFAFIVASCLAYPWLDGLGSQLVVTYAAICTAIDYFVNLPFRSWFDGAASAAPLLPAEDLPDGGIFLIFGVALWLRYGTVRRPLVLSEIRAFLRRPYFESAAYALSVAMWVMVVAAFFDLFAALHLVLLHLWLSGFVLRMATDYARRISAARQIAWRRRHRESARPNPSLTPVSAD